MPSSAGSSPPAAPRGSPRSRARKILARLGLVSLTSLSALLAAELAVRAFGPILPPRGDVAARGLLAPVSPEKAPGLGFALVQGRRTEAVYPGLPGEEPRVVRYAINEHGFRGPTCARRKPGRAFRIIALGDSFTFGTAVQLEETWPFLLERALAELVPELRFEVLNWGVPAYNTRQELALLARRAGAFEPDLVLLCAYVNDASGQGSGVEAGEPPWEARWRDRLGLTSGRWGPDEPKTPAQARTMALRERSRLADLLAHRTHGWLTARALRRDYRADWSAGSPGRAMVAAALAEGRALAAERGFALHATMYPDLQGLDGDYPFAPEHATFQGLCEDLDIPFHDLLPALRGRDPAELRAHAHDHHPSGACNRIVADSLARGLLPFIDPGHGEGERALDPEYAPRSRER